MPGINDLYISFASDMISHHESQGTIHSISRARIERRLLLELDKAKFPIEWKVSWMHAILQTPLFDSLWTLTAHKHHLPDECTARFTPDSTLHSYNLPHPPISASSYPTPQPHPLSSPALAGPTSAKLNKRHPRAAPEPPYPLPSTSGLSVGTGAGLNPYAKPRGKNYRHVGGGGGDSETMTSRASAVTDESEEYDAEAVALARKLGGCDEPIPPPPPSSAATTTTAALASRNDGHGSVFAGFRNSACDGGVRDSVARFWADDPGVDGRRVVDGGEGEGEGEVIDRGGLVREEGDDGAWGRGTPRKGGGKKGKGQAKGKAKGRGVSFKI